MVALYKGMVLDRLRENLKAQLSAARDETDRMFRMFVPSAFSERPIAERHRLIFYLGHLEAFDRNMVCGVSDSEFDRLFAFGIDPVDGKLPDDKAADWPALDEIRRYNQRARTAVDENLSRATDSLMFHVVVEHRLMHAETLAYMLHWLPNEMKLRPAGFAPASKNGNPKTSHPVDIPAGSATLGQNSTGPAGFGWDNEFDAHSVVVPEFAIDAFNVTNREFLAFTQAGGYSERSFWKPDGWEWIRTTGIAHPRFWIKRGEHWFYRTMFEEIPLPADWPVYASHAEAEAYCRWKGKALPTEAQYHRAAFGAPDGSERSYPWGESAPGPDHGNFDFRSWTPAPVGSFPEGQSTFGVFDLMGNGWEWTGTPFSPFPGFRPFPCYPGYSANFFDGRHFVMKGASPRTAAALLRPSFRNWFQPLYPNIYATFRCVEN